MSETHQVSADELQAAMRLAPAAVSVVTAQDGVDVNGLTATSFCSVSMDPPSMLVCVNQDSRTHALITKSKKFCVNLLQTHQSEIANAFASAKSGEEKLQLADTTVVELGGAPSLKDASANIVCDLIDAHKVGTHTIFVGVVCAVSIADDVEPLLYGMQGYGSFTKS